MLELGYHPFFVYAHLGCVVDEIPRLSIVKTFSGAAIGPLVPLDVSLVDFLDEVLGGGIESKLIIQIPISQLVRVRYIFEPNSNLLFNMPKHISTILCQEIIQSTIIDPRYGKLFQHHHKSFPIRFCVPFISLHQSN